MYLSRRLLTAVVIFLSGIVLIPFISLPAQAFSWQLFADAYDDGPTLTINHDVGQPGSFFEVKGENFPPNATVTVTINGTTLGTVTTDDDGEFEFELATTGADEGAYFVTATSGSSSATVKFTLDSGFSTMWPAEGTLPLFNVPASIAFTEAVYLPIILR